MLVKLKGIVRLEVDKATKKQEDGRIILEFMGKHVTTIFPDECEIDYPAYFPVEDEQL